MSFHPPPLSSLLQNILYRLLATFRLVQKAGRNKFVFPKLEKQLQKKLQLWPEYGLKLDLDSEKVERCECVKEKGGGPTLGTGKVGVSCVAVWSR